MNTTVIEKRKQHRSYRKKKNPGAVGEQGLVARPSSEKGKKKKPVTKRQGKEPKTADASRKRKRKRRTSPTECIDREK